MLKYEKYTSYEEFEKAKCQCRSCSVGLVYNCVVCSQGNKINPKIIIVGEAPGKDELLASPPTPFVGKAGKLLRKVLEENNINSSNSLITNTIPCRPLNNKFPNDDSLVIECKNTWLKEELRLTNPDILLLVGAKSLKFLLNMEGITRIRGKFIKKRFNNKTIYIMPTFHPSFVLRKEYMAEGKQILQDFKNDIKNVAVLAGLM